MQYKIYLASSSFPVEKASWRTEISLNLNESIVPVNPLIITKRVLERNGVTTQNNFQLLKKQNYDRWKELMRKISIADLIVLRSCDLVVANFFNLNTFGTTHEVGDAFTKLIPTLAICAKEVELPDRLEGLISHRVYTLEEALEYLNKLEWTEIKENKIRGLLDLVSSPSYIDIATCEQIDNVALNSFYHHPKWESIQEILIGEK